MASAIAESHCDSPNTIGQEIQLQAWKDFFRNGAVTGNAVRPEVVKSWKRSLVTGLKAKTLPKAKIKLLPENMRLIREQNKELTNAALPFVNFLRNAVRGTGYIISLADQNGIVLNIVGDDDVLAFARSTNFVEGCCRTESEAGTNSIGLCLVTKEPTQVNGAEHFNSNHHSWSCYSAPIFAPNGKLLGVISLSGKSTNSHPHTLGMVISAAESIADKLKGQEVSSDKKRMDYTIDGILRSIAEAVIMVDDQGTITRANHKAQQLIGFDIDTLHGVNLANVFPDAPELLESLQTGKTLPRLEVTAKRTKGSATLMIETYIIREKRGLAGALLFLTEKKALANKSRNHYGLDAHFTFESIKGESTKLKRCIELAKIASGTDSRVLITGETGTGKELFAHAIHNASERRNGPFVAINCAAIPKELVESEIMGYVRGAYTGARQGGQAGKFELANGGTVFLDEIHQMPIDVQAKFLRVLQDSRITRLGDTKSIKVDIRVISSSSEDLYEKSITQEFRRDLYYRLSVVEINIPPLRDRKDDITLVANNFLANLPGKLGKFSPELSSAAVSCLKSYDWPGNIRELENFLEMATLVCKDGVIQPDDLNDRIQAKLNGGNSWSPLDSAGVHQVSPKLPEPLTNSSGHDHYNASVATGNTMREAEITLLREAMKELNGNIAEVSRTLGISRSTIYRRMKEHGINKTVNIE